MAVLELLARPAGTRFVASNLAPARRIVWLAFCLRLVSVTDQRWRQRRCHFIFACCRIDLVRFHVIKVEDKRAKQPPKFEDVKPQIENFIVRKAQAELVTKLRADAKIERMDKPAKAEDKPATPAPAPAAPAKK